MSAAKSSDLLNWEKVADGYSKKNPVYGQIYDVQMKPLRILEARTH